MESFEIAFNDITSEELLDIHLQCDNDFIPRLSSRVDIKEYTKKLFDNASFVLIKTNNSISGVVALYCNDFEKYTAYISSVCIKMEFRGLKYGTVLITETIKYSKNIGMKSVMLEVSKENIIAYNLYLKHGFAIQADNGEHLIMKKVIGDGE